MKSPTCRPGIHPFEVVALVTMGAAILGGSLFCGSSQMFWVDEVYTALPAADPSLSHMLAGLKDEINALPPLYFILIWGWAQIFGVGELSLRFPSALFAVAAIVSIWSALRSFTDRWVAIACSIFLTLLCSEFREHIYEARGYTLYFAAFALAFALYVRGDGRRADAGSFDWRVFAANALLVAVHYVGGLFSGLLVASAMVSWKIGGDNRFRRYAVSALASWVAVIPSLPFYLVQRKLAGQFSWLEKPQLSTLLTEYITQLDGFALFVMLLFFVWLVLTTFTTMDGGRPYRGDAAFCPAHITVLAGLTLLFMPAIWMESRWAAILFLPRYLHPIVIVWISMIAWVGDSLLNWSRHRRWCGDAAAGSNPLPFGSRLQRRGVRPAWLCGTLFAAISVLASLCLLSRCRRDDFPANMRLRMHHKLETVAQYPDVPVIVIGLHEFGCLSYYLRSDARVFMLIDNSIPDQVEGPIHVRNALALERHYFPKSTTTRLDDIIDGNDRILLVMDMGKLDGVTAVAVREGWGRQQLSDDVWLWERLPDSQAAILQLTTC